jgi:hypothetical protein
VTSKDRIDKIVYHLIKTEKLGGQDKDKPDDKAKDDTEEPGAVKGKDKKDDKGKVKGKDKTDDKSENDDKGKVKGKDKNKQKGKDKTDDKDKQKGKDKNEDKDKEKLDDTTKEKSEDKAKEVEVATFVILVNGVPTMKEQLSFSNDGIFRVSFQGKKLEPPVCLLKNPIPKDGTWTGTYTLAGQKVKLTCTAINDSISVPEGKYLKDKTVVVKVAPDAEAGINLTVTTYWFAQEMGLVQQTLELGGESLTMELVKFEEGRPPEKDKEKEKKDKE